MSVQTGGETYVFLLKHCSSRLIGMLLTSIEPLLSECIHVNHYSEISNLKQPIHTVQMYIICYFFRRAQGKREKGKEGKGGKGRKGGKDGNEADDESDESKIVFASLF